MSEVSKKELNKIVRENGIKPIQDEELTNKFIEYISDSIEAFPEFFNQPIKRLEDDIIKITGYTIGYAEKEGEATDGRCFSRTRYKKDDDSIETEAIICVKKDAVEYGREYTILVFWHEFTHAIIDTDNPLLFHSMLDGLLKLYEKRTGEHIENDYCEPV